jgi:hypothetical protein
LSANMKTTADQILERQFSSDTGIEEQTDAIKTKVSRPSRLTKLAQARPAKLTPVALDTVRLIATFPIAFRFSAGRGRVHSASSRHRVVQHRWLSSRSAAQRAVPIRMSNCKIFQCFVAFASDDDTSAQLQKTEASFTRISARLRRVALFKAHS